MKKVLLLIPVIFLCLSMSAEAQTTWEKYFNGNQMTSFGENLCFSTNGNIYFIGESTIGSYKIYIVKTDPSGKLLWDKNINLFSTSCFGYTVIPTSDDGCIISGRAPRAFLTKLSAVGEIEWTKYLTDENFYGSVNDLCKTTDNKLIGCGYAEKSSGYLFKTDSNGNVIWQKIISPGYSKRIYNVIEAIDGGYITTSNYQNSSTMYEFTKYDTAGNQLWSKFIDGGGTVKFDKNNSIYILTGTGVNSELGPYIFIQKLDVNGNPILLKKIEMDNNDYYEGSIMVSNNRFVFTSLKETAIIGDTSHCILRKFDDNGILLAYRDIKHTASRYKILLNIKSTLQNDYIFVGQAKKDSLSPRSLYALRTDSNFYFKPVSIQNEETSLIDNYKIENIFPNPFNPSTQISYSLKKSSSIELKLFDINGRLIKIIESGFKSTGSYDIIFSAEGLSSGVYFFSLYSEGILMDTKKAVVMK